MDGPPLAAQRDAKRLAHDVGRPVRTVDAQHLLGDGTHEAELIDLLLGAHLLEGGFRRAAERDDGRIGALRERDPGYGVRDAGTAGGQDDPNPPVARA